MAQEECVIPRGHLEIGGYRGHDDSLGKRGMRERDGQGYAKGGDVFLHFVSFYIDWVASRRRRCARLSALQSSRLRTCRRPDLFLEPSMCEYVGWVFRMRSSMPRRTRNFAARSAQR